MPLPVRHRASRQQPMQRWDPFGEFDELQQRMGQLMETVLTAAPPGDAQAWAPFADIEETDDAWVVEAEVPGVRREDVNVELRDSELEISGEIKERERKGVLRRQTRRTGRFEYRVMLPGPANADKIDASLHDGVLTVRVPKAQEARPRRIEVKAD
jgi:HSP20 family protein